MLKSKVIIVLAAVAAFGFVAKAALSTNTPLTRWIVQFKSTNMTHFGLKNSHTLVLTFDDGPGDGTSRILQLMANNNLKVTFFSIGQNANDNPGLLQQEFADGHTIGNHSYTHPDLASGAYQGAGNTKLTFELTETNGTLLRILPPEWAEEPIHFFRAPYGSWSKSDANNANAIPSLQRVHYLGPIYWDIGGQIDCDGYDDSHPDANQCVGKPLTDAADWDCWDHNLPIERCEEGYWAKIHALGGGVILSHDIFTNTAAMWEDMLPKLMAERDEDGNPLWKFVLLKDSRAIEQYQTHNPGL